jgi:hypothetical protein
MDDDGAAERAVEQGWVDDIERAVLSETAEGRAIASAFVTSFGAFVSETVRPILREVADSGGEPQLLVNGLAQMLRGVADSVESPVGFREPTGGDAGTSPDGD